MRFHSNVIDDLIVRMNSPLNSSMTNTNYKALLLLSGIGAF